MTRTYNAQTLASLLVFGSFGAAESSVRLLETYPASPFAWYLNFELFHTFEMARMPESPLALLLGPQGLLVNAAVISAVMVAHVARSKLMIAFLANLGFAAMLALIHCRLADPVGSALARAMLRDVRQIEIVIGGILFAASFAAVVSSHLSFVAEVVRERRGRNVAPTRSAFGLGGAPLVVTAC